MLGIISAIIRIILLPLYKHLVWRHDVPLSKNDIVWMLNLA